MVFTGSPSLDHLGSRATRAEHRAFLNGHVRRNRGATLGNLAQLFSDARGIHADCPALGICALPFPHDASSDTFRRASHRTANRVCLQRRHQTNHFGSETRPMHRNARISVVIPCYNEEQGIREVLDRMPRIVDEVVVVDNNCTDRTAAVARAMGARVVEQKRRGYGAAYKAGLRAAQGDLIVTMDGDGSYPPEEIPRLVDTLLEKHWDFFSACRFR